MSGQRGKLKIFFGYAAGVGKTYAMLEAAHAEKAQGIDVVAGYIEPHTRPDTMALLEGLELLMPQLITYRGITLREFDLDGALVRKPKLILVDELAHTNAQGCRHLKRYQDIEELLKAGIDVYTTINVQHIESLNDRVASITGVIVRERIPDKVFDGADLIELVDIEPDDLMERLHRGDVYSKQQASRALKNFFTKQNLVALREITLRRTADQVNQGVAKTKVVGTNQDYYTNEHILTCLSSAPSNAKVIRAAARMASAFHASFTAVYVENGDTKEASEEDLRRLHANFKLAEQLGAKIVTLEGEDVPSQIAEYAKVSSVSKIILGRSNHRKRFWTRASLVERLMSNTQQIDIYIIPDYQVPYVPKRWRWHEKFSTLDCMKMLGISLVTTGIAGAFNQLGFHEADIVTVYILGVLITAICTQGKLYSIVASCINVLAFNFLFTVPRFSLTVSGPNSSVTFAVMFISAVITSTLTMRVKEQGRYAALKTQRTEVLLEVNQHLQRAKNLTELYGEMARQMQRLLKRTVVIYPVSGDQLEDPLILMSEEGGEQEQVYQDAHEKTVAQWVYKNNKNAGATTNTLPAAKCLYLAVRSKEKVFAVLGIAVEKNKALDAFDRSVFMAMISEFGVALEKQAMIEANGQIALRVQKEQLRGNLLRAISHDFRGPLEEIYHHGNQILESDAYLSLEERELLCKEICEDSQWLIDLLENLLSVTRLENDPMNLDREVASINAVVEEALRHVNRRASAHHISIKIEPSALKVNINSDLITQVLVNLIDNALAYTPEGSSIEISAKSVRHKVLIEVADDGPGISPEAKQRLFDMFYTVDSFDGDTKRTMGMGLPICRWIIRAHGGELRIRDHLPQGTIFSFTVEEHG